MVKSNKGEKGTPIAPFVADFLKFWLPDVRKRSQHTVRSYIGMFKNLNAYADDRHGLSPIEVTFELLDVETLADFMSWLVEVRGLSPSSANTRLGALKSFAKYVAVKDPREMAFCLAVGSLDFAKVADEVVRFMSVEGIEAMFDLAGSTSLRDLAILRTLYSSGAREFEFLALTPLDVRFNADGTASISLIGKGSKARSVSIDPCSARVLKLHIQQNAVDPTGALFANGKGEALSPSGLTYIVNKYAKAVHDASPLLVPERIHPHMFRHSVATHMLRAGVGLESIRLFLGHSSIKTTVIYAKCDPSGVHAALIGQEEKILKKVAIASDEKKNELDKWLDEEYPSI